MLKCIRSTRKYGSDINTAESVQTGLEWCQKFILVQTEVCNSEMLLGAASTALPVAVMFPHYFKEIPLQAFDSTRNP